jgi:mannose-6-phosphate isomerase-like protein (cupin superfamily)
MRAAIRLPLQLATTFALGLAAAPWLGHLLPSVLSDAHAESAGLQPLIIDVAALQDADLNGSTGSDIRAKTYVATDGATVGVQTGNAPKHFHAKSDEVQYIVEGSGTAWFGDKQVDIRPGMLIIIPKGMNHGGTVPTTGRFKALAIKIPPQQTGDTTVVK